MGPASSLEASHGGFTTVQLWLTLASEAALPAVVVGLYRVQSPQIGCLGRYSAVAYGAAYLYFTYTVIYALAHDTPDFTALKQAAACSRGRGTATERQPWPLL